MKHFKTCLSIMTSILFAMAATAATNASTMGDRVCKVAGEQAERIMNQRQTNADMFSVLEQYESEATQAMVFTAYELPMIETTSQLAISIKALGTPSAAAERRKYDDMEAQQKQIIQRFKNKYIAACIKARNRQT